MRHTTTLHRAAWLGVVVVLAGGGVAALVDATAEAATTVRADTGTVSATAVGGGASVSVSQTANLVNESVRVSWSGFPASSASALNNASSYDTTTTDPVRVYECRGAAPTSSSDCYGSPGFAGLSASANQPAVAPVPGYTFQGQTSTANTQPDGPANYEDTVTQADGTGALTIQVFTGTESPSLGCEAADPCSIVVVPNLGEQLPDGTHYATEDDLDAPWAWADRTVVPLAFADAAGACPLGDSDVSLEGSPVDARLLASWRPGACTQSAPLHIDYTNLGEDQARGDAAAGLAQVGLLSRPEADGTVLSHQSVYAPVSVTSVVVAFQVDDAEGKQVHSMRLDARLVAKLLTASYRVADDPNVTGNPRNIFSDPEFLALNPGVDWPSGFPGDDPLIVGDLSDLNGVLTRWVTNDPTARAFLDGTPDPFGMHVNTAYRGVVFPVDSIPLLDSHQSNFFAPIQGLPTVASNLSLAQPPGAFVDVENGVTVTNKQNRETPGNRDVIGFVDAADAAAFQLDTASLQNTAGDYVDPDAAGMTAALGHMVVDSNGVTRQVDLTSTAAGVYPLTTVTAALLPVDGTTDQRAKEAALLDYVAGPGQVSGSTLGQLPDGYLPLTADLVTQDKSARAAVLAGPVTPTAVATAAATVAGGTGSVSAAATTSTAASSGSAKSSGTTSAATGSSRPSAAAPVAPQDNTLAAALGAPTQVPVTSAKPDVAGTTPVSDAASVGDEPAGGTSLRLADAGSDQATISPAVLFIVGGLLIAAALVTGLLRPGSRTRAALLARWPA